MARGEGAAGGRPLKRAAAIALGLVALVVAVFAQARHHEFVNLDDGIYVVRNPALDAGTPVEPGTCDDDADGQPRSATPDLGADEL